MTILKIWENKRFSDVFRGIKRELVCLLITLNKFSITFINNLIFSLIIFHIQLPVKEKYMKYKIEKLGQFYWVRKVWVFQIWWHHLVYCIFRMNFFFFFLKLRIKLSTKRGFDVPGEKLCVVSYCYFVLSEINIEVLYFEQGFLKMNKVTLKQFDQADIIFSHTRFLLLPQDDRNTCFVLFSFICFRLPETIEINGNIDTKWLTHFSPVLHYYTPWKYQKI